jgi:sensor histidine kinase regulating citrate/malate metabolism
MIAVGVALVGWGLPAAHRLRSPLDIPAALAVLAGVMLGLLGALLLAVPGFFKG